MSLDNKLVQEQKSESKLPAGSAKKLENGHSAAGAIRRKNIIRKIIPMNTVNLLVLAAIIFLVSQLPGVANQIKELRSEEIVAQEVSDVTLVRGEIERSMDQINTLRGLFVNDEGFASFITAVNELENESAITSIDFPDTRATADRDKQLGLPLRITFQGSQAEINDSLEKVLSLPFLLKPTDAELQFGGDTLILRLGLFLIVDDSFGKN